MAEPRKAETTELKTTKQHKYGLLRPVPASMLLAL